MAEGTNYDIFVEKAASATLDPCDGTSPDLPSFIYQVLTERDDDINNLNEIVMNDGGNSTLEFNETRAMGAMYSVLTIAKLTTGAPTSFPTSLPTVSSTSGSLTMGGPLALMVLGALHFLHVFM